jgi:pimeloyl-ACP methyl ester carboxylesterase
VAADVEDLLDHLEVEHCVTAGWSGGGPHALASAALLPGRIRGALSIAGVAPYDAPGFDFVAGMSQANVDSFGRAVEGEDPLRRHLEKRQVSQQETTADGTRDGMQALLAPADQEVVTGEFAEDLSAIRAEAVRTGLHGWVDDDLALVKPWGFSVLDITVPSYVWQGSEDIMVPSAHGQWLAASVPGVTSHFEQGEGHLSIGVRSIGRMLEELSSVL